MNASSKKTLAAKDFDEQFEDGDVIEYLDLKSAQLKYPIQHPNTGVKS
ncbi:MAG: hypothetical protein P1U63_03910 [Coxiellaceae bacterium]|nr:hypothetical protein [Coxiellaceae bacterium]